MHLHSSKMTGAFLMSKIRFPLLTVGSSTVPRKANTWNEGKQTVTRYINFHFKVVVTKMDSSPSPRTNIIRSTGTYISLLVTTPLVK